MLFLFGCNLANAFVRAGRFLMIYDSAGAGVYFHIAFGDGIQSLDTISNRALPAT
jgi:hypothetical protein